MMKMLSIFLSMLRTFAPMMPYMLLILGFNPFGKELFMLDKMMWLFNTMEINNLSFIWFIIISVLMGAGMMMIKSMMSMFM